MTGTNLVQIAGDAAQLALAVAHVILPLHTPTHSACERRKKNNDKTADAHTSPT
jgi:hypothetical protein